MLIAVFITEMVILLKYVVIVIIIIIVIMKFPDMYSSVNTKQTGVY